MSISTKRGDRGQTSLLHGERVSKSHLRVCANGSIDELNAALGLCRAHTHAEALAEKLRSLQSCLVQVMGELATGETHQAKYLARAQSPMDETQVEALTDSIIALEKQKGGFQGWQFPGESVEQAFFEHARTSCRRAEREVVALVESGALVRPVLLQFLNRLSDWLWIAGKVDPVD